MGTEEVLSYNERLKTFTRLQAITEYLETIQKLALLVQKEEIQDFLPAEEITESFLSNAILSLSEIEAQLWD